MLDEDHFKLISRYYCVLLSSSSSRMARVEAKWRGDIPALTQESGAGVIDSLLQSVISARDKIIQFNYLYRVNYTPARLHKMDRVETPECHRYKTAVVDYFHMVWQCPQVGGGGSGPQF